MCLWEQDLRYLCGGLLGRWSSGGQHGGQTPIQIHRSAHCYHGSFKPFGIITDSDSRPCQQAYPIDQIGKFLCYIDNCDLHHPMDLSMDTSDNLFLSPKHWKLKWKKSILQVNKNTECRYRIGILCLIMQLSMVAYFYHQLSDNYVDLSYLYVVLFNLYVDLSIFMLTFYSFICQIINLKNVY